MIQEERKDNYRTNTVSEFGRSYYFITCPFCGVEVKAYVWSISGGGKKCECGAKHNKYGQSVKDLTTTITGK